MEYIITEKTDRHGWCLWKVIVTDSLEGANRALAIEQAKYPEKELRVETVDKEDAWWNDPKLCN